MYTNRTEQSWTGLELQCRVQLMLHANVLRGARARGRAVLQRGTQGPSVCTVKKQDLVRKMHREVGVERKRCGHSVRPVISFFVDVHKLYSDRFLRRKRGEHGSRDDEYLTYNIDLMSFLCQILKTRLFETRAF